MQWLIWLKEIKLAVSISLLITIVKIATNILAREQARLLKEIEKDL